MDINKVIEHKKFWDFAGDEELQKLEKLRILGKIQASLDDIAASLSLMWKHQQKGG